MGGGSLIYANVLLRKDEKWFADAGPGGESWPVSYADLDEHYTTAEKRMGVQTYPLDKPPYDKTPKTRAFKAAAEARGMHWFLPALAVAFGSEDEEPSPGVPIPDERPNYHRRPRETCHLVGDCDIGATSAPRTRSTTPT